MVDDRDEHQTELQELVNRDWWPGLRWRWSVWEEREIVFPRSGRRISEIWDHDHCRLGPCDAVFSERYAGALREGWTARISPNNRDDNRSVWVCPECFELYRERFNMTLESGADSEMP